MIPIKNSYDGKDVPSVAVDTNQSDNVPRKKILAEGGDIPVVIEELTVTSNGDYSPEEGVDGFAPVHVNVEPPTSRQVVNFDFSTSEYDLVRSINMDNPEPAEHALMSPYLYNAAYDSTNGVVSWSNGYGSIQTKYYIEPFKNYDIDIEFGDITSTSTSERQILGMGMGITIYWDGGNNRVRVGNSSGSLYFNDVNSIDYFQNKTVRIIVEWGHDGVYTPTCYAFIKFDGIAERKFIGNIDPSASNSNYLIVGRTTSDDGIYPCQVKSINITEKDWIIEPNRNIESEV